MSEKVTVEFFVVLKDQRTEWQKQNRGRLRLLADRIRQGRPRLERGEAAVRVRLQVDPSLWEDFVPTVTAEISPTQVLVDPTISLLPIEKDVDA